MRGRVWTPLVYFKRTATRQVKKIQGDEAITMVKAKKADWKTCEMPNETASFRLDINMTEDEYSILQNGHVPQEMEDKWFAYFENDTLFVHRSWTGVCIYRIRFSKNRKTADVTVNRDSAQYAETNLEKDKLQAMIRIYSLVNRPDIGVLMKEYIKLCK